MIMKMGKDYTLRMIKNLGLGFIRKGENQNWSEKIDNKS